MGKSGSQRGGSASQLCVTLAWGKGALRPRLLKRQKSHVDIEGGGTDCRNKLELIH